MKKLLILLLSLAAALTPATAAKKPPRTLPGGWVYTWGDEFSGSRLNSKYWSPELGVVRNKGTLQAYTEDALKFKKGFLFINTEHEETDNCNYKEGATNWLASIKTQPYSSGSITTKGKKDFLYGRLEVRAKMPEAKGAWPAIWLVGSNGWGWPKCGEIDILEHLSQSPGQCFMTLHWGKDGTQGTTSKGFNTKIPNPYTKFHIYAMEWSQKELVMFIDDDEVARWDLSISDYPDGTNPFRTPHHLIINTAIGGNGTWPEHADAKDYPVSYVIDYVRYYTKPDGEDEDDKKDKKSTKKSRRSIKG